MYKDLSLIKEGKFEARQITKISKPLEAVIFAPLAKELKIPPSPKAPPPPPRATPQIGPSPIELEMEKLKGKITELEKEEKVHAAQQEQITSLEKMVKSAMEEKERAEKSRIALEQQIIAAQEKARLQEEAKKKAEEEKLKAKTSQLEILETKLKGLEKEKELIFAEKITKTGETESKIDVLKKEVLALEKQKQLIIQEEEEKAKMVEAEKRKIKEEEAKLFEKEIKTLEEERLKAMLQSSQTEKQISLLRERIGLLTDKIAVPKQQVPQKQLDEIETALLKKTLPKRPVKSFDPYKESIEE